MQNIFKLIIIHFKKNDSIKLERRGHFYTYIGISETRINKVKFPSITYKISTTNQKRVTKEFIDKTYEFYEIDKKFPDINWYRKEFPSEIKSRPCNKSVAKGLIETILKLNN